MNHFSLHSSECLFILSFLWFSVTPDQQMSENIKWKNPEINHSALLSWHFLSNVLKSQASQFYLPQA